MKNRKTIAHQRVWSIAFPMLLVGISTPLLGIVDTAVVGHLSEPYFLGAIAIGAMIFNFLFWGLGFLRMGTTGLTARAIGEVNKTELNLILYRGLFLASGLGVLLIVFQGALSSLVFSLIDSSDEVLFYTKAYFDIRIWAAPATLGSYVLLGWFLGQGKPRWNLILVVTVNVLNIILDVIFVVWLDLNAAGVAWATLIAEYTGLLAGLVIATRLIQRKTAHSSLAAILEPIELKKYLVVNLNVFIRTILLLMSFALFTWQGAKYGELVLAANAILMNLQTLMAYVLDSIAHAAEVLVGKYYHAKQKYKLKCVLIASAQWSAFVAIFFSALYWLFGSLLFDMLTGIQDVKLLALQYLPWLILSPLVSVWSYWLDGLYIGANLMQQMRNTMLISFLVFLTAWQSLLSFENHGLWAALTIFMAARAITMGLVARKYFVF